MKRWLPHMLWFLLCLASWWLGRQTDASSVPQVVPDQRKAAEITSKETGSPASSPPEKEIISSLEPGFDFPPDWDARTCVEQALRETNSYLRLQKFQRALQRLTPESAGKMQDVFNQFADKGLWFVPEYDFFLRRWGEIDGKTAAEFAINRGQGDKNGWARLVRFTLSGWAANDPDGVVNWINESTHLKDWQIRSSVQGVTEGLVERNPDRAVAFALMEADGPDADAVFRTLTERLTYGPGIERAEKWLAEIPADRTQARSGVLSQLVDYRLRGEPDSAASLLTRYADQNWVNPDTVRRVAGALLSKDTAKYQTWLDALPPGVVRSAGEAVRETK